MSVPVSQLPPLLPPPPNLGQAAFVAGKLAYQICPIILTSGIATNLGGALPIIALTQGVNTLFSLIEGQTNPQLDGLFCNYHPLPGASMINNQISMYPFANQTVAANAIISQPLNISLHMYCPAGAASGGYPFKLVTMIALQNSLQQHNNAGGLYTVITPSFIYANCIMTGMRDVSGGDTRQPQYVWQLDFFQPLVTQQASQGAQNGLIQKLTNGTAFSGTPSWTIAGLAVNNPTSLIQSSFVPPTITVQ